MSRLPYAIGRAVWRSFSATCMRPTILHRERLDRPGGYVLACTHLSHLEPVIVSMMARRKIDWMARLEFYRHPAAALMLRAIDAFPVNRFGVPVGSIRAAIDRAGRGRVVGIFPEGGVARGRQSVMLGGAIKAGACLVSQRAGVPIVPVAILGTEQLMSVKPWLPLGRTKLWLNVGRPLYPPVQRTSRRCTRLVYAEQLRKAFIELHRELGEAGNVQVESWAGTREC